jgi:Flp pilus assembly protein TadG
MANGRAPSGARPPKSQKGIQTQVGMWKNRKEPRERGQTFVEFALALPLLTILLFGIIQFGFVFHNYVTVADAARVGARKGAGVRPLPASSRTSEVVNATRASAQSLDQSKMTVSVTSVWVRGSDVTVTVAYPYEIRLFGMPVRSGTLRSTTVDRVD